MIVIHKSTGMIEGFSMGRRRSGKYVLTGLRMAHRGAQRVQNRIVPEVGLQHYSALHGFLRLTYRGISDAGRKRAW